MPAPANEVGDSWCGVGVALVLKEEADVPQGALSGACHYLATMPLSPL